MKLITCEVLLFMSPHASQVRGGFNYSNMPSGIYKKTKEHKIKLGLSKFGSKNPSWKGGISLDMKKYLKNYRKEVKQKLIEYKLKRGCKFCGYNKCPDALEFHHLDKKDKKIIGVGRANYRHSWESVLNEIKKCIVLCANCHKELHYNLRNNIKTEIK